MSHEEASAPSQDESLRTLEEISRLVSNSGNPTETLTNIVELIQRRFETDVCSVYLLEPDRSNLVLAATVGLRPESVGRVRMRLNEGLAGLVGRAAAAAGRRGRDPASAVQVLRGSRRGPVPLVPGRAGGRPRPASGRARGADDRAARVRRCDVRMLMTAGTQLAPLVSEARTLGQFVAPAHRRLSEISQNLWWSWDAEATSLFRDLDPVMWRDLEHNPIALLQKNPDRQARGSRVAAGAPRPHQLHLPPHAGIPRLDADMGRAARRRAVGTAGGLLLGRVRPARVAADLFGRPRAFSPAITSRARRTWASRSSASGCTTTRATSGSGWTSTAGSTRSTSTSTAAMLPIGRPRADGAPVTVTIETRTGAIAARVWTLAVGRNTLLLLDSNVAGNSPEDRS